MATYNFLSKEAIEGGYDYQFVDDPPESLKCLICLLVAREPQQHGGCGKLFCKTCITQYKGNDCPHCRQIIRNIQTQAHRQIRQGYACVLMASRFTNTTIFNDFKSDQEVKALMIFCTTDCGWKGPLESVNQHETNDCENTEIFCLNACNNKVKRKYLNLHCERECPRRISTCFKCKENMEYRDLDNHVTTKCLKRQHTCPYCNETGVYDELTTTHLTVCPKVMIKCSKCSIELFRCNIPRHALSCPNELVHCKYYNIGCQEKPFRKHLSEHEQDHQFHLGLAMNKILMLSLKHTLTFKVAKFEQKKDEDFEFFSPDYCTSQKGYKVCLEVDANGYGDGAGTHVSVFAHLMKGDHDDTLTWPFTGSVTVELLNQLEDKNHLKETTTFLVDQEASKRVVNSENGSGWGLPQFISHTALNYNASTNTQYLKDDTLVFRVSAEAPDHKPWLECTN